jgi:hypothetical protein
VNNNFFKFPSTQHLATPDGVDVRGDKVLSVAERDAFLRHELIVEEKIDGANLGISFDGCGNVQVQNRGTYLQQPLGGQWKKLTEWLNPKTDALFDSLSDRYILFGEWCYAKHSIFYNYLPDLFLAFDVYDRAVERFFASERRDKFFAKIGISKVPTIATGCYTYQGLSKLLSQSTVSSQPAEGLYLRFDKNDWLEQRAKLVRPTSVQSMEQHWSHVSITPNRLCAL